MYIGIKESVFYRLAVPQGGGKLGRCRMAGQIEVKGIGGYVKI